MLLCCCLSSITGKYCRRNRSSCTASTRMKVPSATPPALEKRCVYCPTFCSSCLFHCSVVLPSYCCTYWLRYCAAVLLLYLLAALLCCIIAPGNVQTFFLLVRDGAAAKGGGEGRNCFFCPVQYYSIRLRASANRFMNVSASLGDVSIR